VTAALALDRVTRTFGGLAAVSEVSFTLRPASLTALIGPNGAGKTTLFNLVSGLLRPDAGRVTFNGLDLARLPPHEICRAGIGRSFQTPQIFGRMTVLENVMVAAQVRGRVPVLTAGLRLPAARREEEHLHERAVEQLEFLGLGAQAGVTAGTLPLGQQRLLEIARALATKPHVLLLDEPAAGLTRGEVRELRQVLFRIQARSIAVLLVEHNMRFVLGTAEHVIVLNHGQKLAEGEPTEIARDPRVVAAYLGRAGGA
jgi:ABC-type branched-subunit amino acid transport system ATPase component